VTDVEPEGDARALPRIEEVDPLIAALRDLVLPPPVGEHRFADRTLSQLEELIGRCGHERPETCVNDLRTALTRVRNEILLDVRAAFDGDPACTSETEAALCYPGIHALAIHRLAHALFRNDVPLMPRLLNECIHRQTGIDIHPGARIGNSFFIDHGTGVVIGESCVIGNRVKLYHGVTLGAFSNRAGRGDAGKKRHPTLENDVTIYPNASILGGDTVIGEGSVIGGNVWLTQSVPPYTRVTIDAPSLQLHQKPPTQCGEGI